MILTHSSKGIFSNNYAPHAQVSHFSLVLISIIHFHHHVASTKSERTLKARKNAGAFFAMICEFLGTEYPSMLNVNFLPSVSFLSLSNLTAIWNVFKIQVCNEFEEKSGCYGDMYHRSKTKDLKLRKQEKSGHRFGNQKKTVKGTV
jgi:hypothetical protein